MGEYQEEQVAKGLKATKYVLGDMDKDGHTHIFYLRDDLPIATTVADVPYHHAHSISKGPGNTVICDNEFDHRHEDLIIEIKADYILRNIFNP